MLFDSPFSIISWLSFLCYLSNISRVCVNGLYPMVELNKDNTLILKNVINEQSTSDLIHKINLMRNKSNIYIYLDTPGGEVENGMKIIDEVKKYNISCIAERAYSMGFAIFQSCSVRYIVPHGKLMQHQISYGHSTELGKMNSYIHYINNIHTELVKQQSRRMRLPTRKFEMNIQNEWWIFGSSTIEENAADEMIHAYCTQSLTNQVYNITRNGYIYTYSSCPLVTKELEKTRDKSSSNDMFFFL